MRDTVWRLGNDYALLKWSPHPHKPNKLRILWTMLHQPKNKLKTLPLMRKIKDKINLIRLMEKHQVLNNNNPMMMVQPQMMSKINLMMKSKLKKLSKLKLMVKTGIKIVKKTK